MADMALLMEKMEGALGVGEGLQLTATETAVLHRLVREMWLITDDLAELDDSFIPSTADLTLEEWLASCTAEVGR